MTMVYGNPVAGYPSLIVVVLFLGGIQLSFIGILGEYVGRMFDESKGRPLYLVKQYVAQSAEPLRVASDSSAPQAMPALISAVVARR
jgi:hypothetical protein